MSHCHACGKAIDVDSYFCPFCGTSTEQPTGMETRPASTESRSVPSPYMPPPWYLGPERVSIGEVLSASWRVITKRPIIVIPHLVSVLVGVILGVSAAVSLFAFFSGASTEFTPLAIVALLIVFIISTTIEGFYPLLVQRVVDGDDISLQAVGSHALGRISSLLGVAIIIALLTGVGSVAIGFGTTLGEGTLSLAPVGLLIVIAGTLWVIYVMIWYFCAIPFLMLENRGALDALSASKTFSSGKKWSIFGIILVVAVLSILVELVVSGIFPGTVETGLLLLVSLFFMVYNSVLPSYLYLRYGTPRAAPPPPPPAPVSPAPVSPMSATSTICPACGAEVEANQTYCGWCGSKLP